MLEQIFIAGFTLAVTATATGLLTRSNWAIALGAACGAAATIAIVALAAARLAW